MNNSSSLDYSRAEIAVAARPHAHEAVVNYCEWAATKPMR